MSTKPPGPTNSTFSWPGTPTEISKSTPGIFDLIHGLRGVKLGDANYLLAADVDRNGVINGGDLQRATKNLGASNQPARHAGQPVRPTPSDTGPPTDGRLGNGIQPPLAPIRCSSPGQSITRALRRSSFG